MNAADPLMTLVALCSATGRVLVDPPALCGLGSPHGLHIMGEAHV